MGAPGMVSGVVRVRERGDADVVRVEERNEHERREMGGCAGKDGTAVGLALALPPAPCTQNTIAKLRARAPWMPGAKLGHDPLSCQNRLCASTVNAPNAPRFQAGHYAFQRRHHQPRHRESASKASSNGFDGCDCVVCSDQPRKCSCVGTRATIVALDPASDKDTPFEPLQLSLHHADSPQPRLRHSACGEPLASSQRS